MSAIPVAAAVAALGALLLAAGLALARGMRRRHMHLWLSDYLRRSPPAVAGRPVHVMVCVVDHLEPMWNAPDPASRRRRVDRWCAAYREMAGRHRDADGRPPQHSIFCPQDADDDAHLDTLSALCAQGFGEIEVHLRHDNDTEPRFRATIGRFCRTLHEKHGALTRDPDTGRLQFGVTHGHGCLDNARADGRWCGLDNELILLRELGCYADFTLPTAPGDTQTATVNSIYYATDDPLRPKSHNRGQPVKAGGGVSGDLMIVQGPLALDWRQRRLGVLPRIENADVADDRPPTEARVDLWVKTGVHVEGRPDWVIVKVHAHGTGDDQDTGMLPGAPVDAMHRYLQRAYNDGQRHVLHYVTARETYNIIKAAEAGEQGDPGQYRDYLLPAPRASWVGRRRRRAA